MRAISLLPEDLLSTQEGLSSVELHSQSPPKELWINYVRDTVTAYYRNCTKHTDILSTRSPFVTLFSRRAQSGRRTSYGETGAVHRITYSLVVFFFYLCFIYSFYSDIK